MGAGNSNALDDVMTFSPAMPARAKSIGDNAAQCAALIAPYED